MKTPPRASNKDETDCSYMLNEREQKVARVLDQEYQRIYKKQPREQLDLVYFLGDNPSFSRTWSARGRLPCFRRNTGFYLQRATGRVMTSVDRLTALGWPTTEGIASNMLTTCLPTLDTRRGELMAGNAMALGNVSIVILVGLSCFKRVSDSERGWYTDFKF